MTAYWSIGSRKMANSQSNIRKIANKKTSYNEGRLYSKYNYNESEEGLWYTVVKMWFWLILGASHWYRTFSFHEQFHTSLRFWNKEFTSFSNKHVSFMWRLAFLKFGQLFKFVQCPIKGNFTFGSNTKSIHCKRHSETFKWKRWPVLVYRTSEVI